MAETSNGNTRWQVYAAIGGLSVTVVVALIGLNVQLANTSYTAATNKTSVEAMQNRLDRLEERSSELRTSHAQMETKLTEIETQFCASDIIRNLMHANDMRMIAMLWSKANAGEHIPTDNSYYPMVCNRSIDGKSK